MKGVIKMSEEKETKKKPETEDKKHMKASEIKGKIEVQDTRERRDGPGGD